MRSIFRVKPRARRPLKAVLKQDPDHYPAHYELARLYLETSRVGQAAPHLRVVATLAPLHWAHLEVLRKQLTALGQWPLAVEFEAALATRSGLDQENWMNLFKAANMAADEKVMRNALRRSLILRPQADIIWKAVDAPHLIEGLRKEMCLVFERPRCRCRSTRCSPALGLLLRAHNDLSGIALVAETADRLGIAINAGRIPSWLHVKSAIYRIGGFGK